MQPRARRCTSAPRRRDAKVITQTKRQVTRTNEVAVSSWKSPAVHFPSFVVRNTSSYCAQRTRPRPSHPAPASPTQHQHPPTARRRSPCRCAARTDPEQRRRCTASVVVVVVVVQDNKIMHYLMQHRAMRCDFTTDRTRPSRNALEIVATERCTARATLDHTARRLVACFLEINAVVLKHVVVVVPSSSSSSSFST